MFSIIWQRERRHTSQYVIVLSNAFDKLSLTVNVSISVKRMDYRMISIGFGKYMRVAERLITVQYDTFSWRSQIQDALVQYGAIRRIDDGHTLRNRRAVGIKGVKKMLRRDIDILGVSDDRRVDDGGAVRGGGDRRNQQAGL